MSETSHCGLRQASYNTHTHKQVTNTKRMCKERHADRFFNIVVWLAWA